MDRIRFWRRVLFGKRVGAAVLIWTVVNFAANGQWFVQGLAAILRRPPGNGGVTASNAPAPMSLSIFCAGVLAILLAATLEGSYRIFTEEHEQRVSAQAKLDDRPLLELAFDSSPRPSSDGIMSTTMFRVGILNHSGITASGVRARLASVSPYLGNMLGYGAGKHEFPLAGTYDVVEFEVPGHAPQMEPAPIYIDVLWRSPAPSPSIQLDKYNHQLEGRPHRVPIDDSVGELALEVSVTAENASATGLRLIFKRDSTGALQPVSEQRDEYGGLDFSRQLLSRDPGLASRIRALLAPPRT